MIQFRKLDWKFNGMDIKKAVVEVLIVFIVGALIGSVLAVVSNLFVEGVDFLSNIRGNFNLLEVAIGEATFNFAPVMFLVCAAAIVVIIRNLLKIQKWAGPADAMYAAHQVQEPLDLKRGFGSTLAAFTSACGGASVGQYGPLVHFGATIGIWVKRFMTSRFSHDVYLGCGVAAAISAGFNAPIAGVIFAHEAVLRHFSLRAIAPIIVASVTASALGTSLFPGASSFEVAFNIPALAKMVPALVILAPFFALVAILFMWSLRKAATLPASFAISPNVSPFVAAFICGSVGIWVPEILGLGLSAMNSMIAGQFTIELLVTVLILKIMMTSLCIGFGLFGGVFSPALFVGIAAGALAGQLSVLLGLSDLSNILSIAGMAAVASSVIGAPISAILIVLELTRSYECAVAAMLSVTICSLITLRLFGNSFFDRQLLDRSIDLRKGREAIALGQKTVGPLATGDFIKVAKNDTGHQVLKLLKEAEQTEAYVVNETGILIGKLDIHSLIEAGDGKVADFVDKKPVVLLTEESLQSAMVKVSTFVGESLPIVFPEDNRLKGTITEGDLFQAVIEVQKMARDLER